MRDRERRLSSNTQRNYRQYLRVFFAWLEKTHRANLRPRDLTAKHVWDYRLYLARSYKTPPGRYLTKKSQNFYLIALRALLRYLAERDIETLPSTKIKLAKQKADGLVPFLERQEVEEMLERPDTDKAEGLRDRAIMETLFSRDRAVMETLFSSGMRIAELVALDVEQLAPRMQDKRDTERTLELPIVGKGNHIRTIFISPRAAHWIRTYLVTRGDDLKPLFINSRSRNPEQKRLTPRAIQLMIAEIRAPGRALKEGDAAHPAPHLRHRPSVPRRRSAQRPGAVGPQERVHDPGLHPRHQQAAAGHP